MNELQKSIYTSVRDYPYFVRFYPSSIDITFSFTPYHLPLNSICMDIYKTIKFLHYQLFIIFLVCTSCQKETRLEQALKFANNNRKELEMVLQHYSVNPSDSLKLKAAIYLIENMPGHFSYAGEDISKYYDEIKLILSSNSSLEEKLEEIEKIALTYSHIKYNLIPDSKVISGDFLIQNIEQAFSKWNEKKILKYLTFEQFCEFLLPYKVTELQQLDNWRDSLYNKFSHTYNNEPEYYKQEYSVYDAATSISFEIGKKIPYHQVSGNYYKFLNGSLMKEIPFGICDDYANVAVAILRSEGIPVVVEYLPQWGADKSGHCWYTLLNNDGNMIPFYWGMGDKPGGPFFVDAPIPKVFRKTYKINEEYLKDIEQYPKGPFHNDIFSVDVTSEYLVTSNISIPVFKEDYSKNTGVYIAAFNNTQWNIIDKGKNIKNKANFYNMGRNIVYLVFGYDGLTCKPISYPFILHYNGNIEFLEPDYQKLRQIKLTRKYPKSYSTAFAEERLIGGEIHASNFADFSNYSVLYTIEQKDKARLIHLENELTFRYWRYYSPPGSFCNIAELHFFEKDSVCKAKGKIIGTLETSKYNTSWHYENTFDEDWLTFFEYEHANDGWIGLDMQKPVTIDRVRCVPRSDDNGIRAGDQYECFFWDKKGWKSLGKQIAEDNVLFFDLVPENSLLLLKNHTRGVEERIFTYEEDKQIWW